MGNLKIENAQDAYQVRQLAVKEEILSAAVGTDDDFYEVIPGYLDNVKQWKEQQKANSHSNY